MTRLLGGGGEEIALPQQRQEGQHQGPSWDAWCQPPPQTQIVAGNEAHQRSQRQGGCYRWGETEIQGEEHWPNIDCSGERVTYRRAGISSPNKGFIFNEPVVILKAEFWTTCREFMAESEAFANQTCAA